MGMKKANMLYHVVIQMTADNGAIAMGIMNRDSGLVEERVEIFSSNEKRTVLNLSSLSVHVNRDEICKAMGDWDTMLYKRGFEQIVADFLHAIKSGGKTQFTMEDSLRTHQLCEEVVTKLSAVSNPQ
jgi:virulence factor